ncbi:MAG: S8 family serine peptidase [Bacteroidetes bacterium]|nr:S8 family serine peptidase [Bacteroidota bacterium]
MKRLLFVFAILYLPVQCQEKYLVFFSDKNGSTFNPYTYFDSKAIERRIKHGINLYDSTDFPINQNYVAKTQNSVDSIGKQLRWFNAVTVFANTNQIDEVKKFSFVREVVSIHTQAQLSTVEESYNTVLKVEHEKILQRQLNRMQGDLFINSNNTGKGIRIAVFDAGFPTVDTNPCFEHIRKRGGFIKTYDFVKNRDFVYSYNQHGTMVLSCIAGKSNTKYIGLATEAEFLLARTEYGHREPFSEEENWLAAVEWADKNGADIINSSLGYTNKRYFTTEMDGHTSLVSKAANLAVKKGILVVNAVGNEGSDNWKTIITPSDADSVLAVGGIDPDTDYRISFSSFGPNSEKKIKPNVCALGKVIAAGKKGLEVTQGTSFASPLIAGFAACVLSMNKNFTAMQLFDTVQKSGDLYPYFDYAHGYGVPQAEKFMQKSNTPLPTESFELIENNGVLEVTVNDSYVNTTNESRKENSYQNHLFYHIENKAGYLSKYYLIKVSSKQPVRLVISDFEVGTTLRFHYQKHTITYTIK